MKARELLDQGDLTSAMGSLNEELKAHPTDQRLRIFLYELLCYAGDLERAGRQLDVLRRQAQGVDAENGIQVYQDLMEAERTRERLFGQGLAPRFLFDPGQEVALHLEAVEWARVGETARARELLDQAATHAVSVHGAGGGTEFDSIRDADDLLAPVLEVFSGSAYYWVPWAHIQYLEVPRPTTLRDLLWAPARLALHDGQGGEVFLPTLYPLSSSSADDMVRLGRKTEWVGEESGVVQGVGRKLILVGEDAKTLLEIDELRFTYVDGGVESEAPSPDAPRVPGELE